eukprot:1372465-Amphidinium_carterae.1
MSSIALRRCGAIWVNRVFSVFLASHLWATTLWEDRKETSTQHDCSVDVHSSPVVRWVRATEKDHQTHEHTCYMIKGDQADGGPFRSAHRLQAITKLTTNPCGLCTIRSIFATRCQATNLYWINLCPEWTSLDQQ